MADRLPPPPPSRSDEALQYTHSGDQYLLGYGETYFGIWDRANTDAPVARFPRTSEGWQAVWRRYADLQPTYSDVGLGVTPIPSTVAATTAVTPAHVQEPRRAVGTPAHPAWWLLPILMGWMGGLIAWVLIREQDPSRARAMLVTGIVATVAWLVLYWAIVPVAPT
jgi:hypothetical protein